MKKKLTTILLAFIFINSYSQITITDTHLLNIGDVIYQSEDYNTQINIGPVGQGQVWDFSQLNSDDNWNMNVIDPNNSPYSSNYPNADVCIMDDGEFMYATRSSNGIHILGSGDSILQSPLLVIPLPLAYGASFTDGPHSILDSMISGNLNMLLPIWFGTSIDTLALFLTNGQAHIPDTLNIRTDVVQNFLVDADGEIALPMGTFDCVRLSKEMIYSNVVSIYFTDTLTGMNSGWYPVPGFDSDAELVYAWFSNDPNANFSLLEVTVDSLGNQDGSIVFLDGNINSSFNLLSEDLISVYPVPTTDKVSISTSLNNVILTLKDVTGKKIKSINFSNSIDLDLSRYDKGIYFLYLENEDGFLSKKIVLE